jgi:hypothetical protein
LEGWKEIGGYFGRDQRTAQRWEKEGLPVFREGGKVYARTTDLERWRALRVVTRFPDEAPSNGFAAGAGAVQHPETEQGPAPLYAKRQPLRPVLAILTVGMVVAGGWYFWPREVAFVSIRQITRDGSPKFGKMASDGTRIFFSERAAAASQIVSARVTDGDVTPVELAIEDPQVLAFSVARRSLLVANQRSHRLYEIGPGDLAPREILPFISATSAAWDSRGRRLAISSRDRLVIVESGKPKPVELRFTGVIFISGWNPRGGSLRMEVYDVKSEASSWYDVEPSHFGSRRISPLTPIRAERSGDWSADGKFFVFQAEDGASAGRSQIWIADYSRLGAPRAYRITNDDRTWRDPIFEPGSHVILAGAAPSQGHLVRLSDGDRPSSVILPGAQAYELDYSRDGQWIAYTRYPENSVWRCRIDGTDRKQVTPPDIEAHQPHWSPDGTRIAFVGRRSKPAARWRVYLVSGHGGPVDEVLPEGDDQGVPTWRPDGRRIFFGDRKSNSGSALIHELNLATSEVDTIAAPVPLWSPRMSPDGKYLAAVGFDDKSLFLRDNIRQTWRKCVAMDFIGEPIWPADSSWVQFIGLLKPGDQAQTLFRVGPACQVPKPILDLASYVFVGDAWVGITPDQTPLGLLRIPDEIFAIDWRLRRRLP